MNFFASPRYILNEYAKQKEGGGGILESMPGLKGRYSVRWFSLLA
jgi:hypothetical protein